MPELLQRLLDSTGGHGAADDYHIDPATYREQKGTGGLFTADFPQMTEPRPFDSRNEEIFIISDLHIATGRDRLGVYSGSENFFADEALGRFLQHAAEVARQAGRRGLLVINGDSFDFLRVIEYPIHRTDFALWQRELKKLNIEKSEKELVSSVSPREKIYGLETDDYKTIYKLIKIRQGHPGIFAALGRWMAAGNRLLMTKGNHDLEIAWLAVRNYIRLIIAEEIAGPGGAGGDRPAAPSGLSSGSVEDVLRQIVLPHIFFRDDATLVGEDLYIEHGHRYDKYTMVLDSPFISFKKSKQINLPFGSFFNRYLINRLELAYPFLDKVRPGGNVVPMLVRENLPLAIRVFFKQIPLLLRILRTNKRYTWFMVRRFLPLLLTLLPILAYLVWVLWPYFVKHPDPNPTPIQSLLSKLMKGLGSAGSLLLSYFGARAVAFFQIVEPSSLNAYARHVINSSGRRYKVMTMGHTHNPDACIARADEDDDPATEEAIFYNSGTWIPVIEIATAAVREDKIYTFLHLATDDRGALLPHSNLQRWNDEAGREDPQLIIDPK